MIEIRGVVKSFDKIKALTGIDIDIGEHLVFGLVGTNGAGKSTLMRLMAGVLKENEGTLLIDGEGVYNNAAVKEKIFYIPDSVYYFPNTTVRDMGRYYRRFYPNFDEEMFYQILNSFQFNVDGKLADFSKGMRNQVSIILALAAKTKYIFADETFDGLDAVMRQSVKSLLASQLLERDLTVVLTSHNLRELEDISDHIGFLHRGGVLLSKDLADMKLSIHKIQAIFHEAKEKEHFLPLDVLQMTKRGSLHTLVVRGEEEAILAALKKHNPLFIEALPLSLEEIFISETEVKGYDVKKLIL